MRRKSSYPYFVIFFFLLGLMSLPKAATEKMRGTVVAFLAPTWNQVLAVRNIFQFQKEGFQTLSKHDFEKVSLENQRLRTEVKDLKEMIQHELRLISHVSTISQMEPSLKKRHYVELQKLFRMQLQAVPARVIFRSPVSWSSSLWIDVGEATNQALGNTVIAKNSPVLVGASVVGVIDYVDEKQSRVRLLTDSELTPSVRALRDSSQTFLLAEKMQSLSRMLQNDEITLHNKEELSNLLEEKVAELLKNHSEPFRLAKGELHGSSLPLWRSQHHLLKGSGFNYDFADQEGPSRDLRTGQPEGDVFKQISSIPLIKSGDILVTTGMDGVFPPDLLVGEVTKVHPLEEGDYYYELEAVPTAGNLDELSFLFVIPPVSYSPFPGS